MAGKWKLKNVSGTIRSFVSSTSAEAVAWMKTTGSGPFKWNGQEWESTKPESKRKGPKRIPDTLDLRNVYLEVITQVDQVFPEQDPTDSLIAWVGARGIPLYDSRYVIDLALREHGDPLEKQGLNALLCERWEQRARDELYEAEQGSINPYSPFYQVINGTTIRKNRNPWNQQGK